MFCCQIKWRLLPVLWLWLVNIQTLIVYYLNICGSLFWEKNIKLLEIPGTSLLGFVLVFMTGQYSDICKWKSIYMTQRFSTIQIPYLKFKVLCADTHCCNLQPDERFYSLSYSWKYYVITKMIFYWALFLFLKRFC